MFHFIKNEKSCKRLPGCQRKANCQQGRQTGAGDDDDSFSATQRVGNSSIHQSTTLALLCLTKLFVRSSGSSHTLHVIILGPHGHVIRKRQMTHTKFRQTPHIHPIFRRIWRFFLCYTMNITQTQTEPFLSRLIVIRPGESTIPPSSPNFPANWATKCSGSPKENRRHVKTRRMV